MVMTMHRLTAANGYQYLLKHTASGDCDRSASSSLTGYYTTSGNPPGRWLGRGLPSLDSEAVAADELVTETQMAHLYGRGAHPETGIALGRGYPPHHSAKERIAAQVERLPREMSRAARAEAIARITQVELAKPSRTAVAGFDLTFTATKSVSTLWAVADPQTQAVIVDAHRAAVGQALRFLEDVALFTRTGKAGCRQHKVQGAIAAAFNHWDSRAGDPNLHTHVVVANKVKGPNGAWLSVDSRALHHAVVMVSETYDDLLADELARRLPVGFEWRQRGARRSPAFEIRGVDDALMAEFSARATQIDEAMTGVLAEFYATHGRGPNRNEISRLRQRVTRSTRPDKHVTPLGELVARWRDRAARRTGLTPEQLVERVISRSRTHPARADDVPGAVIDRLAEHALGQVMTRRSTWTRWNVTAETARTTRALRMASPEDRRAVLERVTDAVLQRCVNLQAPDPLLVGPTFTREGGGSQFTRAEEPRYTHRAVLDAETRLLDAATADADAPTAPEPLVIAVTARLVRRTDGRTVTLAEDQVAAVAAIAASRRRVNVLVGPAGTGKTTTLAALKDAWERTHGWGAVIGLAPSATAAAELGAALGIACENTAKWRYETTGPGAVRRAEILAHLHAERVSVIGLAGRSRLRVIDTAIANLTAQGQRYRLRAGQLLVIDEASLAGTFALDDLTAQAAAAGAKVLLVGDHAQLSAVDAGGAFHLLVERARPVSLTSLWRFSHAWEGAVSRRLRTGDRSVIDTYIDHDRISAGPAETMCEDAYTSWQADTEAGTSAILLAPDAATVDALNLRAHNDRVTDGIVTDTGYRTTTGTPIGIGDRIITRTNNRALRHRGGHVRNGDLWDVTAVHPDGSVTVTAATGRGTARSQPEEPVWLPAAYVAGHVDLGYATTTHRAQGITVDHAHVLASAGMTRENLYVAMTRGRHLNRAYVAIDDVDPLCDDRPATGHTLDGHDTLETILATTGAELSATEIIAASQDEVASLRRLEPIRETLLAEAAHARHAAALPALGFTAEQCTAIATSPAYGPLVTALERGRTLGDPMPQVLTALIRERPLPDPTPETDLAAVLCARVNAWLRTQVDDPTTIRPQPDLTDAADGVVDLLAQVDALIADRVHALTDHAVATEPAWLTDLGPVPTDPTELSQWRRQVAARIAYEDFARGPVSTYRPPPTSTSPEPASPNQTRMSR